jgi:phosphoserine aminotransferase
MSDILDGGEYRGVVNAPDLSVIHKLPGVMPFVLLCERIGAMHGQLLGTNKVSSISISLQGRDVADSRITEVMKSAVLKGVLGVLSAGPVTYVSAAALGEELGLQVSINMSDQKSSQSSVANTISVELEIEGLLNMTRSIRGTVFGKNDIRVTEIDGFNISVPTVGNLLLFNNKDEPGVLKGIVEKVSSAGCNIAHFSLGRKEQANKAMGALVLDTKLSPESLQQLRKNHTVSNVIQLEFESVLDPIFRVKTDASLNPQGLARPSVRPVHPEFSSGPCKKRPGYSLANLRTDVLGRSHRSSLGKSRLKKAIEDTKRILGIPKDYLCGVVPASDTGAFEMSMWSMLGARPVDVCYWESFGKGWKDDIVKHLKIPNVREFKADYGQIPNFSETSPDHDIIFTFNGTTSGVRVPNLDWIRDDRKGLTFNDCTSAAFAMDIDWTKTDVSTYSWQKVLGGEGAHGMLILSPRAVERLETFKPDRSLPKIFRMTKAEKDGSVKVDKNIFVGDTINTPSMLCVEDYIDALEWTESIGGLEGLIQKSSKNLAVIQRFVAQNDWISFLAKDTATLSNTSVCLELKLTKEQVKKFVTLLQNEGVAYDIGAYRDAPDGLRIWCGATVEEEDLEALMPWLKVCPSSFFLLDDLTPLLRSGHMILFEIPPKTRIA